MIINDSKIEYLYFPMKVIWILNHAAITPEYPGGTRHYELAKRIAASGNKVVIFASSVLHQNPGHSILPASKLYRLDSINKNFKFVWIASARFERNDWRRLLNMFTYSINVLRTIGRLHLKMPDFIIGSTVDPIAAITGLFLSQLTKSKFAFEIRDLWPQTFLDMNIWGKYDIKTIFFKIIEKFTVKNSDKIIVLSPLTKKYILRNYKFNKNRIYYLPNGVAVDGLEINPVRSQNFFNVMYLGAIESVQNLESLIFAAKLLKEQNISEIKILLVGNGKQKKELVAYTQKNSLDNVEWLEPVKKKYVQKKLAESDALYLSTAKVLYGSENKLYDYLAAGRPIISFVESEYNDPINFLNCGISLQTDNPIDIVRAIISICKMPLNERYKMGERAKRYVQENHNWDKLAGTLLSIINSD
jgi:glycosyltransferase involved in cell wall biosynthesis